MDARWRPFVRASLRVAVSISCGERVRVRTWMHVAVDPRLVGLTFSVKAAAAAAQTCYSKATVPPVSCYNYTSLSMVALPMTKMVSVQRKLTDVSSRYYLPDFKCVRRSSLCWLRRHGYAPEIRDSRHCNDILHCQDSDHNAGGFHKGAYEAVHREDRSTGDSTLARVPRRGAGARDLRTASIGLSANPRDAYLKFY